MNSGQIVSEFNATYNKILRRIPQTSKDSAEIYSIAQSLKNLLSKVTTTIDDLNKYAQEGVVVTEFRSFIELNKESYKKILIENCSKAIKTTKEFDLPQFSEPLIRLLNTENLIEYSYDKSKIGTTAQQVIIVAIEENLKRIAGTIEDYYTGINFARKTKGLTNVSKRNKAMGSHMWAEKYYGTAREGVKLGKKKNTDEYIKKYFDTIALRIESFKGLAPYWYILEYGNIESIGMYGDGTPYPSYSGQHFVKNSEKSISALASKQFSAKVSEERTKIRTDVSRLLELANAISLTLSQLEEYVVGVIEARAVAKAKLEKSATSVLGNLKLSSKDQARLQLRIEEASLKLATGGVVPGQRIELGTYQGVRFRARTVVLFRENRVLERIHGSELTKTSSTFKSLIKELEVVQNKLQQLMRSR